MTTLHRSAASRLSICLLLLAAHFSLLAQSGPPRAAVRDVTDTYFGQAVIDPYRWMEDRKSPELSAWMKAQADYARAFLDSLPLRNEFLKRIKEVSQTGVRVSGVERCGDRYFYYRVAEGEIDRKLYVRDGVGGAERLLVDPEKRSKRGKHYSLTAFSPSQDGKYVSYLISPGGSELGELRVLEVATGQEPEGPIAETRLDAGSWMPDNRSIAYVSFQKDVGLERFQRSRVQLHRLGSPPENDRPVFGYEVDPRITLAPAMMSFMTVPQGSRYAAAMAFSGVSPNKEWYIAPIEAFDRAPIPWRRVSTLDDEVSDIELHGNDVYCLTYKNAPRYKVVRTSAARPELAGAPVVFAGGDAVVERVAAARDALYVQTLDGGSRRVHRVDYTSGKSRLITLPYDGSASITAAEPNRDGMLFTLLSWTRSPALFQYDPAREISSDTGLIPPIPVNMSAIEAVNVKVRSHDGVMVPLVILRLRELPRDGRSPTLLWGYGAYGIEMTSPHFLGAFAAWLERGGTLALAGVRGGGEYGEEWHLAGKQATKPNTWKDFIACGEYLVREKYSSPKRLSGMGRSAGGILIGNAITERPDLFRAAVILVGINNPVRFETTPSGVPNMAEFGTQKTEAGFRALLAMDPYHKVKDGVKYPAVLLTHGINDPRVDPWMSAKMAARLQAATSSGYPVLLRIDYDVGHGFGSTREQENEERADIFTFLFHQLREELR